jgi:flagellar protein FlgJ
MIKLVSTVADAASNAVGAAADGAAKAAKLKSAAQAFEAVFLRQMISSMRDANLGDGLFDSDATKQFQDMADAKVADNMSQHGVLGIAEVIEKQLAHVAGAVTNAVTNATATKASDSATATAAQGSAS